MAVHVLVPTNKAVYALVVPTNKAVHVLVPSNKAVHVPTNKDVLHVLVSTNKAVHTPANKTEHVPPANKVHVPSNMTIHLQFSVPGSRSGIRVQKVGRKYSKTISIRKKL